MYQRGVLQRRVLAAMQQQRWRDIKHIVFCAVAIVCAMKLSYRDAAVTAVAVGWGGPSAPLSSAAVDLSEHRQAVAREKENIVERIQRG